MNARLQEHDPLPDVAQDPHRDIAPSLAWVGMSGVDVPLQLAGDPAELRCDMARASLFVDLPGDAGRGIHMSRLYREAGAMLAEHALGGATLQAILRAFLESHAGISSAARLELEFDVLARRRALLSDQSGWKRYPFRVVAGRTANAADLELACRVGYSSTCPASAALSRQLGQQAFARQFPQDRVEQAAVHAWLGSPEGMPATPHGQRSEAHVRVRLAPDAELPLMALVDDVEQALKTPLQTAVKRRDEQEFARLNGENLLFCEDAARRVHKALDRKPEYLDFAIRCAHFESLHPHDAVAMAVKGIPDGFVPA